MNFDLALIMALSFVAVLLAFRQGFRFGQMASNGEKIEPLNINIKKPKIFKKKETDEEYNYRISWENLENYGTCKPQKKLK